MHAYPNGNGDVTIRIRSDEGAFCIEIRDRGIPFNPDEIPPIDLEKKIQLGTRGGLGIYLFKTLMDEYSYKRDGDENVLTICKRIAVETSPESAGARRSLCSHASFS